MNKKSKPTKVPSKIKIKTITPKELKLSSKKVVAPEKTLEEKAEDSEEEISNQKFREFLAPTTEVRETIASKKPRGTKSIEQDEEVLSFASKQKETKQEGTNYVSRGEDYNLVKINKENTRNALLKADVLEKIGPSQRTFDSPGRARLITNTESPPIQNTSERNYTLKDELLGDDIKYKPRRLR